MNSYLDDRKAIDRLKFDYALHKSLIVGFDFDCTVYDFHHEDLDIQPIISLLKRCSDLGFTMCLFSLSQNENDVNIKTNYCINYLGIRVDYVNEGPVLTNSFPPEKKKPYFNILLDDRAGLSSAYNILLKTLDELGL
jgi:hypothetical protein